MNLNWSETPLLSLAGIGLEILSRFIAAIHLDYSSADKQTNYNDYITYNVRWHVYKMPPKKMSIFNLNLVIMLNKLCKSDFYILPMQFQCTIKNIFLNSLFFMCYAVISTEVL